MSREDLHTLFTDLAEQVPPPQLAARAAARAGEVRRRRRTIAAAAAVVALVSTATVVWLQPNGPDPAPVSNPTTSAAPEPGTVRTDHLPSSLSDAPNARPYWPESIDPPVDAATLAAAPMSHAVLLFSPYADGLDAVAPIYAYGEGSVNGGSGNGNFHWARLDVALTDTRDGGGNRAVALKQGSLGPMGLRAAFAQPDEVVVVDIRTGAVDRIPLPGLNEDVVWLPDGRHVFVSSATQTWLVDVKDHTKTKVTAAGYNIAALVGGGRGVTLYSLPGNGPSTVLTFDDSGLTKQSVREITHTSPYTISSLTPRGWQYGHLIAQGASGQADRNHSNFVVVVDASAGALVHVLDLGPDRNKGCCTVLGWQNARTIIVRTEQEGLLLWDLTARQVTRLAGPFHGAVSVAPTGCDWSITIAGITSSCLT